MQKSLILVALAMSVATSSFAQSKQSAHSKTEGHIAAIEQAGWTAWKSKDQRWYQENTTADVVWINSDGITDKSQFLKDLSTDCDVKDFTLSDYKATTETKDFVILTYTAMQDAVCGGKKVPERIRASVVYVKRNGKWLEAFYMETPLSR